jgi:hypothetical protein
MKAYDLLKDLERALRGLDADQGRIARRNARAKVKRVLRRLSERMDAEYPTLRKTVVNRRAKFSQKERQVRLIKAGWVQVDAADGAAYAAHGVPLRRIRARDDRADDYFYVPGWATPYRPGDPVLVRIRRSPQAKRAAMAAAALGRSRDD